MQTEPTLADFPFHSTDKLRFGDMDRQGHVNNVCFMTFLETGRVEVIYDPENPLAPEGHAFVVAHLELDFKAEILWPGTVTTGTRVASFGKSSIKIEQALFQNDTCVCTSRSVVVLVDQSTRRSAPLTPSMIARLSDGMAAPA